MGKTKAKSNSKSKEKVTKSASKPSKSNAKAEKAPKAMKATASKSKDDQAHKSKSARVTTPAVKAKVEPKKAKPAKKEPKVAKREEVDLFEDDEITDSEELLEYEEDLELTEEDTDLESEDSSEEAELDSDDSSEDIEPEIEELEEIEDEALAAEAVSEEDEDIYLTDAEGNRYCRAKDCDQISAVDGYCRYHYLLLWKRIQVRKEILQDGKLEKYVEDLTSRYPDKFLEMLRKDLRTTKDFLAAIAELEIDESAGEGEFEEDAQTYIDEVRGISDAGGASMEDDEF